MLTRMLVCLSLLAVIGCGGESPVDNAVESKDSPLTFTGNYRGSYKCGADWWHVEQPITLTLPFPMVATIPAPGLHTTNPGSNEVQIECWYNATYVPSQMVWGGVSYYNTQNLSGPGSWDPYHCTMYSHRANKSWSAAANVWLPAGSLQLYQGSPSSWVLSVQNESPAGSGTHDGIGDAQCGGSFYVVLE